MNTDLLSLTIPKVKLDAVRKALTATFGTIQVEDIQMVTGGMSSALVYKIRVNNAVYLLRLTMAINELSDPVRHFTCMNLAAEHGIAPKVYYTNSDDAVSITGFINAKPMKELFSVLHDPAKFSAIISAIHALPLFPELVNFLDGVDGLIQEFKALNILPEDVTAEAFSLYAKIKLVYSIEDSDHVASHNDLNPNNMLFDGEKVWVVDWEAAFRNDRYVDLAIAAQTYTGNAEKEEMLLTSYFTEVDDYKRARFFLMQQVCFMYYSTLSFSVAAKHARIGQLHNADMHVPDLADFRAMLGNGTISLGTYEGSLNYGKVLFNTLLKNMKTDKFAWAIGVITNV